MITHAARCTQRLRLQVDRSRVQANEIHMITGATNAQGSHWIKKNRSACAVSLGWNKRASSSEGSAINSQNAETGSHKPRKPQPPRVAALAAPVSLLCATISRI